VHVGTWSLCLDFLRILRFFRSQRWHCECTAFLGFAGSSQQAPQASRGCGLREREGEQQGQGGAGRGREGQGGAGRGREGQGGAGRAGRGREGQGGAGRGREGQGGVPSNLLLRARRGWVSVRVLPGEGFQEGRERKGSCM